MSEEYSANTTTKNQRQRHIRETLALTRLGGCEPSDMAKAIAQEYIDGTLALDNARERILVYSKKMICKGIAF